MKLLDLYHATKDEEESQRIRGKFFQVLLLELRRMGFN